MYGGIPQQVIGSTSTLWTMDLWIYGLGKVISSLWRGRGFFSSDDITTPRRSAPKHLLWYSASTIHYSYPVYTLRKVQRFILYHHSWSSYSTRVDRENVEVFGLFSAWPLLN